MRHLLIGGPKNDIIDIYLRNEYMNILFFDEKCFINTSKVRMVIKNESGESLILGSWNLFEPIESLLESIYIVRQVRVNKSLRFLYVYFFLENPI